MTDDSDCFRAAIGVLTYLSTYKSAVEARPALQEAMDVAGIEDRDLVWGMTRVAMTLAGMTTTLANSTFEKLLASLGLAINFMED